VLVNETKGPDRAPGFHSGEGPMTVEGEQAPAFGYYVGPARRITVKANGKTVTAKQATWSDDPSVVVFWFDTARVKHGAALTGATAYDKAGKKLARGSAGFGVG
jgi:hypothetical protein